MEETRSRAESARLARGADICVSLRFTAGVSKHVVPTASEFDEIVSRAENNMKRRSSVIPPLTYRDDESKETKNAKIDFDIIYYEQ